VVAEFVHEVGQEHDGWSARDFTVDQSLEKGPYRIDLVREETGIGQIDIAISYLLFTSAAKFECVCQVLTDTTPPVLDGD
jgi:hypothetical protein